MERGYGPAGSLMFNSTDVIAVFGMRGCGKTFLSKHIQSVYPRRLIFDTLFEYTGNIVQTFDEYGAAMLSNEHSESFEIIYRNDLENPTETFIFNEILRIAFRRGSLLISIEEVQAFHDVNHYGVCEWLENVFLMGRHRNVAIIFSTQRVGMLNKTLLSQCNHIFIGRMHERNDIKAICDFTGLRPEHILSLKNQEFYYWNMGEYPHKVQLVDGKIIKLDNSQLDLL